MAGATDTLVPATSYPGSQGVMTFGPLSEVNEITPSGGTTSRLILGYFDKDTVIDGVTYWAKTGTTGNCTAGLAYCAEPEAAAGSTTALGGDPADTDFKTSTGDIESTFSPTFTASGVVPAGNWLVVNGSADIAGIAQLYVTVRYRQFRI